MSKAVARVKVIDAARPKWWNASLPELIDLVLNEPATAKRMENGLNEAKRVRDGLAIVTAYEHEKSSKTEMRDGREYYRLEPVAR